MAKQVLRLYPEPSKLVSVQNLYIDHYGWYQNNAIKPKVVANSLSSLDGRIAVSSGLTDPELPKSLVSKIDFRLFIELYAQADCLITHGGYLRSLAENKLGNILQLPTGTEFEDLHTWRNQQGLNLNPDLVIASSSLKFPIHASLKSTDQKIYIATTKDASRDKMEAWQHQGYEVLVTESTKLVQGKHLIDALSKLNYKNIYLIAGPKMLYTMLQDQQLDKLYLSHSHQLLGGENFRTFVDGDLLSQCHLKLSTLFYDETSDNNCGQFFSSYTCIYNK